MDARFADDTFKHIFLNENVRSSIKISLKFVPNGLISRVSSNSYIPIFSYNFLYFRPTPIFSYIFSKTPINSYKLEVEK